VPLSEHEQRLLDQIERALYAEDPKFASTVRATDLRTHARRRLRRAAVLFVLGLVVMVVAVIKPVVVAGIPVVGLSGFLMMFAAAILAGTGYKRLAGRPDTLRVAGSSAPRRPTGKRKARRAPLMDRFEERWRRRWEERGR